MKFMSKLNVSQECILTNECMNHIVGGYELPAVVVTGHYRPRKHVEVPDALRVQRPVVVY